MLSLPSPIQRRIISFLFITDAVSLAMTCKALQDFGESHSWRNLDLCFDPASSDRDTDLASKARLCQVAEAKAELPVGEIDLLQGSMEYLSPSADSSTPATDLCTDDPSDFRAIQVGRAASS